MLVNIPYMDHTYVMFVCLFGRFIDRKTTERRHLSPETGVIHLAAFRHSVSSVQPACTLIAYLDSIVYINIYIYIHSVFGFYI